MEENCFTASGVSPFEVRFDLQKKEGQSMMICSEMSMIPRKKRSNRVGIFKDVMTVESPLEFLASVAVKWSELNERLPFKKRKIETVQLKEINEFGDLKERMPGESSYEIRKRKREFSSPIVEIPLNRKSPEKKQKTETPAIPPPRMAAAMAEKIKRMGGERVEFVIEKQLHHSDLKRENSRLSIPLRQLRSDFLSSTEKRVLTERTESKKRMKGIRVLVIDPRLEEHDLRLKMWKMTNTSVYNLIEKWNDLVDENELEEGDRVRLWAFRVEERRRRGLSDLCFALAKVEDDNNGGGGGAVDNGSSSSTITTHDQD